VRSRLLLDGDGRGKPFDQIDIGLLHQLQKLPCVGRQRFHVAALTFRVERIEGQRGFTRAGKPGNHDQPIARQIEVDVLEIVGAGTADANFFHDSQAC